MVDQVVDWQGAQWVVWTLVGKVGGTVAQSRSRHCASPLLVAPLPTPLFSPSCVCVVAEWVCVDVATCMGGAWTWCTSHGGMTTGVARLCHGMVTVQAIATTALVLLCPLSCLPLVCVCE